MNKHKAKAARLRELKRKENEEESKRLAANWKRLSVSGSQPGTGCGRSDQTDEAALTMR
jgi:hypothetical protein